MMPKVEEANPTSSAPTAPRTRANAPSRRLHRNHSAAVTKTHNSPGSSRGSSSSERWKPLMANLSLMKLLKVESYMLKAMPIMMDAP